MNTIIIRASIVTFFGSLCLVVCQLVLSNELAIVGYEVAKLDKDIALVSDENRSIVQEIAKSSSLATISQKAHALGFVPVTSYMSIVPDSFPVALKPSR